MEDVIQEFPLRKCSSAQLRVAAAHGRDANYNRQLTDAQLDTLDERGVHVIAPFMTHEHAEGEVVDPHLRCFAYMKGTDGWDSPTVAVVDLQIDDVEMMDFAKAVVPNG